MTPTPTKELALTADMSVAPEIARLAVPSRGGDPPGSPRAWGDCPSPHTPLAGAPEAPRGSPPAAARMTLGALAGQLRSIAATPERWWGLVRFDPDRSAKIMIEDSASHQAWLVVLPPGAAGHGCDCDVATMVAGEATEGTPSGAVLRPGQVRVHGQQHGMHGRPHRMHALRGRGAGYSISLHARAHRPASQD
jgi:hypothetical protein